MEIIRIENPVRRFRHCLSPLLALFITVSMLPCQALAADTLPNPLPAGKYTITYDDSENSYVIINSSEIAYLLNTESDIIVNNGSLTLDLNLYGTNNEAVVNFIGIDRGSLTIEGSGTLIANNSIESDSTGIYVNKTLTMNSGTLIGSGSGVGIVVDYDGSIIVNSGILTGNGELYGILVEGPITVEGGALKGIATDGDGISSQNLSINVTGGKVIGEGGGDYGRGIHAGSEDGIIISGGSLTGTGSRIGVASSGIIVTESGLLIGTSTSDTFLYDNENGGVRSSGDIFVEGDGKLYGSAVHPDGYGVCSVDSNIYAYENAHIYGEAPYYAILADYADEIKADGDSALIKGTATASNREESSGSSAVMFSQNSIWWYEFGDGPEPIITATNGGMIWEYYPNILVAFNDTDSQNPYENGVNIESIANYKWTVETQPHLTVSESGLLALYKYDGAQEVNGIRTENVSDEVVDLSGTGTHKITFYGTLEAIKYARYKVIYNANGARGSYEVLENIGTAHRILANSDNNLGFTRSSYTFRGWSEVFSSTSATYTGTGNELIGAITSAGDSITLYAVWKTNNSDPDPDPDPPIEYFRYKVIYDANGGSGSYEVLENVGAAHKVLANSDSNLGFTQSGHTFKGWSEDSIATSATYTGTGSELIGTTASADDRITLYAV